MDNKNKNSEEKGNRSKKVNSSYHNKKPKDGPKSSSSFSTTTSAKLATSAQTEQPSMSPQRANNNSKWSSSQSKFNRILGNLERTILNQFSSGQNNSSSSSNNENINGDNSKFNSKQQQKQLNPSAPQAATTTNSVAAAVLANAAAIAVQIQNKHHQLNKDQQQLTIIKSNSNQHQVTGTVSTENQHHKGIRLQQQPSPSTTSKSDDGKRAKMTLNKYQQQIVSTLRLPNRHLQGSENNGTQQPIVAVGVSTKLSIPPPHANDEARSNRLLFGSKTTAVTSTTKHETSNGSNNVNSNKLPSLDRLAGNSSPSSSAKSLPTIGINQKVLFSDRSQNYNSEEKTIKNKCSINNDNNNIDVEEESGFSTYQSRRSIGLSTTSNTGLSNNNNNTTGVTSNRQLQDQPKQTLTSSQSNNNNNTLNNNMIVMQTSQVPIGSTINYNQTNNHHQQQQTPSQPPFGQQHITNYQHHLQNLHHQQQQQHFISYSNYLQQQQHNHDQKINTQLQNQILSNQVPIMSQHNSLTNCTNTSSFYTTNNSHDLYNNNNLYGHQQQLKNITATSASMAPTLPLPALPLPPNQTGQVFNHRNLINSQQHQQQIYANAPPKPRRYQYYEPNLNSNQLMTQQQNLFLNQQRQQQQFNIVNRAPLPIQKPQPPPPPLYNSSYLNFHGQSPDSTQNSLYHQQQSQVKYFPSLTKSKSSLDASDLIGFKHQQQDNYNVDLRHNQHHQQRASIYGSQIIDGNNYRYPSMTLRPSYSVHNNNNNNQQFANAFNNLIAQQQAHNRGANLQRSKSVTHLLPSNDYELNYHLQPHQLSELQLEHEAMFPTNTLNNNNSHNNNNKKFLNSSSSMSTTNLNYFGSSNTNQHNQSGGHQIECGNSLSKFDPSTSLAESAKFFSSQITRINTNNKWDYADNNNNNNNNNDSVQVRQKQQQRQTASNWIAVTSNQQNAMLTTTPSTSSNVSVVTTPATSATNTTTTMATPINNNNNRAINFLNDNNNSKLVRQTQQGEHISQPPQQTQSKLQEDGFNNNAINNNSNKKPSLDDKIRFLLIGKDDNNKQGELQKQQVATLSNIYYNKVNGRQQVSAPTNTFESNSNNGLPGMKHALSNLDNTNNLSTQLFARPNKLDLSTAKETSNLNNNNDNNINSFNTPTLINSNNLQRIYINESGFEHPNYKSSLVGGSVCDNSNSNGNAAMGNRHNHNGKNSYDVSAEISLQQQNSTLVMTNNNNIAKENSNSHLIVDLTTPRVLAKTQTNLISAPSISPIVSSSSTVGGHVINRPSSWSINQLGLPQMNSTIASSTNNDNVPNGLSKTKSKISPSSVSYGDIQTSLSLTYDINQAEKKPQQQQQENHSSCDNNQRSAPYYYSDLKSKEQQMALLSIVQQKSLSPPPQLLSRSNDQSNTRLAPRSATMHANQARALSENLAAKQQQYNLLKQQQQQQSNSTMNNYLQNKSTPTTITSDSLLINKNIDKLFEDKSSSSSFYNNDNPLDAQSQFVHSMVDLNDCKDSNEVVSCLASFPVPNNQKQHFLSNLHNSIQSSSGFNKNLHDNIQPQQAQMSTTPKQALFNKSKSLENIAQKSSSSQVNDADLIVVNCYHANNNNYISRNPVYENIKRSDKLISAINNSTTCLSSLTSRNKIQQSRLNQYKVNSKNNNKTSSNTSQGRYGSSDESMNSIPATSASSTISSNSVDDEENCSSDDNSSSNSLNLIDEINISSSSDNHLGDIIKLIEQLKSNHSKLTEEYKSTLIKIANTVNNNNNDKSATKNGKRSHHDDKRKEEKLAKRLELLELKSKKCESRSKNQLALIQIMEKLLKQQSKSNRQQQASESNKTSTCLQSVNDDKKDDKHLKPIIKAIVTENDTTKIVELKSTLEASFESQASNTAVTNTKSKTNEDTGRKVIKYERKYSNKNPFNTKQDFNLSQDDDDENEKRTSDQDGELEKIKKHKRNLLNFKDDEDFIEFLSTDNSSHRSSQFEASQFSVSDFNTSTSSNQSESSAGCCNDSLNSPIISSKSPQQQISSKNIIDHHQSNLCKASILKKGDKFPSSYNNNNEHDLENDNDQQSSFKTSTRDKKSDSVNNNDNNNDDSTGRQSADSFSVSNSNNSHNNSMTSSTTTNRFNNVLGNVIDVDVCSLNNMSPVNHNHHESQSILN